MRTIASGAGASSDPHIMDDRPPITGFLLEELEKRLEDLGTERYRARQVLRWIYGGLAESFEVMTDLSRQLRQDLPAHHRVHATAARRCHLSSDGTTKILVGLDDARLVETVLIPEGNRRTVCVSTQVGCPVGCLFCASGLDGLVRNLSAAEIVEQVLHAQRLLPEGRRVDGIVVMGIGEPLLNAKSVIRALRIWRAPWGLGIGYNRITLSTVGILPKLRHFTESGVTPNLALSLHAPNDRIRGAIVPTMKRWPVAEIIRAGEEYRRSTGKDVTFEYVLLEGVNDERSHALELGERLAGSRCKVNVIPYNTVEETPFRAPSPQRADRFVRTLRSCGVGVTLRKRKGDEVAAACGQLRARTEGDSLPDAEHAGRRALRGESQERSSR